MFSKKLYFLVNERERVLWRCLCKHVVKEIYSTGKPWIFSAKKKEKENQPRLMGCKTKKDFSTFQNIQFLQFVNLIFFNILSLSWQLLLNIFYVSPLSEKWKCNIWDCDNVERGCGDIVQRLSITSAHSPKLTDEIQPRMKHQRKNT